MFSIATYLARSEVQGIGVFTAEAISAGTTIWEFTPGVDLELTEEDLDSLPDVLEDPIRKFTYLDESGLYVLCGDNARFMNHSFDPNCDDSSERHTRARRDIEAGEELTCDYRQFDVPSRESGLVEWKARAEEETGVSAD